MRIEKYIAGAALIVLPFVFSSGLEEQFRWPKVKMLLLVSALYLCLQVGRKINIALGWACAFAFFSAFWIAPSFDIDSTIGLCAALGTCFWVAFPSEKDIGNALKLLKWIGVACAIYGILQHYDYDLVGLITGSPLIVFNKPDFHLHPSVTFGQQTLYGPFAVACFAAAMFECRWSSYAIAALLAVPIFFIDSSLTYLSFAVVIGFWLVYRLGRRALLLALIIPGVYYAGYQWAPKTMFDLMNANGRYAVWEQTYRLTKIHPVVGFGFGSFKTIYPAFQDEKIRHANGIDDSKLTQEARDFMQKAAWIKEANGIFISTHNEFLQLYFECGLIGVVLAMLMAFSYCWRAQYLPFTGSIFALHAIFFSFLANSIGNFPLHLIPQALLPLWAYVAVTTIREDCILDS